MARLLHTSDWHLGGRFHGVDRSDDEQAALDTLISLCQRHAIDAVLISGDIFDTANPGAAEQQRYYRTLVRLVQEGGVGTVVVIAGNHDSGARLDGPRELLAANAVHVRGVLGLHSEVADCLVSLRDRQGQVFATAAAIPYIRETDLAMPPGDDAIATRQAASMQQRFTEVATHARSVAAANQQPLIVLAHAFIRGSSLGGAERPVLGEQSIMGTLGQVDASCVAEGSVYAAFGHLHRPQKVGGNTHWRYSGSLLPTGFDEIGSSRSVVIATLSDDPAQPASIELIDLPDYRQYRAVRGTREELAEAIAALPQPAADDPKPLLMATVLLAHERHGVAAEIAAWADERGWLAIRIMRESISVADPNTDPGSATTAPQASMSIEALTPLSVFHHAHQRRHAGNAPHPDIEAAFITLLAEENLAEG